MPAVPPRLPRTRRTVTRNDTGHTDMPQGRQHRPHSSNQPIAVKTHALLADPGQRRSDGKKQHERKILNPRSLRPRVARNEKRQREDQPNGKPECVHTLTPLD